MTQLPRASKILALLFGLVMVPSSTNATIVTIEAVPSAWRLENYSSDEAVVIWYATSSGCAGGLRLPSYTTQQQRDRLYTAVVTGKMAGRKIGLRYDDGTCEIDSFYFVES